MSTLEVYFRDAHCAQITEDTNGNLKFQYLDSWVEQGRIPISLTLPLDQTTYAHEQITPFVANLLPEGDDLRGRLERLLHIDTKDDFGLLGAIGRESAGALSFWPEGESPRDNDQYYSRLSLEDFQEWREFAHQQPFQFRGQTFRMSLAGAQAKTALYFDSEDNPYLPEYGAPTSHILKPNIEGCLPSTVFTEYLTMKLARVVLGRDEVPEVDIWQNCYRIRRYDRPRKNEHIRRLHQEDFCLALGRMPARKYESEQHSEHLLAACFDLLDQLGDQGLVIAPVMERQRLLNQVVLNVLLHNPDAHLKNYALMLQNNGMICVTPLYDCLCTYGLNFSANGEAWGQVTGPAAHTRNMSLRIGGAIAIDTISQQDWSQFAIECGFTAAFVRRRVRELAKKLGDVLPHTIESVIAQYPIAVRAANAVRDGVSQQINMVLNEDPETGPIT
jgi:serine/threonine-protein kinase HipA